MRAVLVMLAALASGLALGFGCSSSDAPAEPARDAQAPSDAVAPRDASVPSDGAQPDPDPPPGLPEGWELDRSYWNQCGFYVPTSKQALPPPLSWEPCPADAEPPGADCRLMTVSWPGAAPTANAGYADGASIGAGGVILGVTRSIGNGFVIRAFVEADGAVRSAILQTRTNYCGLAFASIFQDRYSLRLYEARTSEGGGAIASELGTLRPRLALHLDATRAHSMYAGPFALLDLSGGTFHRFSWTDGAALAPLWSSAQDDGLQQGEPVFAGDAMFWPASNSLYHKVKVYTPATAVRDFLTVGLVFDRGFGDLGTDGTDLVWIDAQGRASQSSSSPFTTLTIMTAPFTTEPSAVVPRRLRTEEGPSFDVRNFVVGCGFAARANGYHVRIVRLSDGRSWVLANAPGAPVAWELPLALTCTELFASVRSGGATRTARVRLDSIGPGIPPD